MGYEGRFRMLNGTRFEVGSGSLYGWALNNPDNASNSDCVHILTDHHGLNDAQCTMTYNAIGDGKDVHGLCEIPKIYCKP